MFFHFLKSLLAIGLALSNPEEGPLRQSGAEDKSPANEILPGSQISNDFQWNLQKGRLNDNEDDSAEGLRDEQLLGSSRRRILGASPSRTCEMSYCAGFAIGGQTTCDEYGALYSGQWRGCGFGKAEVQCCKPAKKSGCLYTNTCYGINYGGGYVCRTYFGNGWAPSGKTNKEGCGWSLKTFECCKN